MNPVWGITLKGMEARRVEPNSGLGKAITLAGLHRLRERGDDEA